MQPDMCKISHRTAPCSVLHYYNKIFSSKYDNKNGRMTQGQASHAQRYNFPISYVSMFNLQSVISFTAYPQAYRYDIQRPIVDSFENLLIKKSNK